MNKERVFSCFWAFLVALLVTFGGLGCLATAFEFSVSIFALFLICLFTCLLWAVVCYFSYGGMLGWSAAGILVIFDFILGGSTLKALLEGTKNFLHQISVRYDKGYHWGFLQWGEQVPDGAVAPFFYAACLVIAFVVVWSICRRQSAILAVPVAVLPLGACMVLIDTVPQEGYLLILLVGLLLLLITNPLRRRDEQQANRLTAMLLVPVLLVSFLLFRAAPQEGYEPLQEDYAQTLQQWLSNLPWGSQGGIEVPADEVPLDFLEDREEGNRTELWVQSSVSGQLYLRSRSYDTYDGKNWSASENSNGADGGWGASQRTKGTVRIETVRPQGYYFLPSPPGEIVYATFEKGLLPNTEGETSYTVSWAQMANFPAITDKIRNQCQKLPVTVQGTAEMFVYQNVYNGYWPNNMEKGAERIADFVRNSAQYSLNPEPMPEGEEDFAFWFLQEAESGYCVHFATAAVVLLRAAHIPARYVTGYLVEARAGERIAVTQKQAHAWAEYYDMNKGWTVLEATPGYDADMPVPSPDATVETTVPTTDATQPTQETTAPTEGTTAPTMPTESVATAPTDSNSGQPEENENSPGAWWLWIVILTILAVWGQYRIRLWWRKRWLSRGDANEIAIKKWHVLIWHSRILKETPPEELLELTQKAKFSQHYLTQEELAVYDSYAGHLQEQLRKKPWLIGWLIRLLFAMK